MATVAPRSRKSTRLEAQISWVETKKVVTASPLPWPQPGPWSCGVAVTMGLFLFLPALRARFDQSWPAWLYTSPPVCESPPELSDVWEVSNTDAFSLTRLCLMDAGEISRFTETGPCGIFWNTECFICLLLWSYGAATGIFSCTTAILYFEETTNAWINVNFLAWVS